MAEHNETGKRGELLAKAYLESKSFSILEQNFRYGKAEIDIIATVETFIVAVEVKTRKSAPRTDYFHAVNKSKMSSMVRALEFYMRIKGITLETRFDFVRVDLGGAEPFIEHTPSFFIP
ncbi:MAG: YraN family protein [Cryomorphaceae bacterium]|nr:YraN family protein [Cryomorphaceae bacterium]